MKKCLLLIFLCLICVTVYGESLTSNLIENEALKYVALVEKKTIQQVLEDNTVEQVAFKIDLVIRDTKIRLKRQFKDIDLLRKLNDKDVLDSLKKRIKIKLQKNKIDIND